MSEDPFLAIDLPPTASSGSQAPLHAHVVALTNLGKKRKNNEDNYLVLPLDGEVLEQKAEELTFALSDRGLLIAVADGMGGHQSGEVASRLCVEHLGEELFRLLESENGGCGDVSLCLRQAVEATHQIVHDASQNDPALEGMGSTMTAGLLYRGRLVLAQVGDSRAYLIRRGSLVQLTEDQTVGNLLRAEDGSASASHINDVLVQAMGAQSEVNVAMTAAEIEPNDFLLICSDGLYKVVSSADIVTVLKQQAALQSKAETLIARANELGGPDNITVVLAEFQAQAS